MTDPEQLSALVRRVEGATGPDFTIDRDILMIVDSLEDWDWSSPPKYSSSLDAAVSFVERALPGTEWEVSTLYGVNAGTVGLNDGVNGPTRATHATPALALILATLRALSAGDEDRRA